MLVAAGCLVMLLVLVSIFAFIMAHKKKMIRKESELAAIEHEKKIEIFKAANEAEEKQKVKIAREIHDEVATAINAVTLSIDKNLKDFRNNRFNPIRLENDLSTLYEIKSTLRNISHNLIPPDVLPYGLIKALQYHVSKISELDGSKADFENRTTFSENLPISKEQELNIFRICLEVINNLLKHSDYEYLQVIVDADLNYLTIDFIHDGKGLNNNEIMELRNTSKSVGLNSIFSRVLFLGGSIDYCIEGESASVMLKVPIRK